MNSTDSGPDPFDELSRIVQRLIWVTAGCFIVLTLVIVAIGLLAYDANRERIDDNEEVVIALCRDINSRNTDLREILLDFNIPAHRLEPFKPRSCNPASIRG